MQEKLDTKNRRNTTKHTINYQGMERDVLFQKYFHAELSEEEMAVFDDLLKKDVDFAKEFELRTVLFADKSVELKIDLQKMQQVSIKEKLSNFIQNIKSYSQELLEEKTNKILDTCEHFLAQKHAGPAVMMDASTDNNDYVLGIEAFKVGMYQVAIEQLTKLDKVQIQYNDLFFYLGLSYLYLSPPNYSLASFYFDKNLSEDSIKKEESNWYLGICYLNLGQIEKAYQIFEQIESEQAWKHKEAKVLLALF